MSSEARRLLAPLAALALAACYNPVLAPPAEDATVVGFVTVPLDASKSLVRTREAPIGNLVSDALREYAEKRGERVDFALMNGGNIRFDQVKRPSGVYPAGEITRDMVKEMLPFGNSAVVVEVSGAELRSILERSVASLPQAFGQFMHVSRGVMVTVDTSRLPQLISDVEPPGIVREGARIESIRVSFAEVPVGATFRLVTNDFEAAGGDGYATFAAIPAARKHVIPGDLELGLEEYLRAHSPVTPVVEGRILIR